MARVTGCLGTSHKRYLSGSSPDRATNRFSVYDRTGVGRINKIRWVMPVTDKVGSIPAHRKTMPLDVGIPK